MALTWIGRPTAIGTNDAWTLGAGSTKPIAVDPGAGIVHDDDTTYISKASGAAASRQSFTLQAARPTLVAVTSLSYGMRFKIITGTPESLSVAAILRGVEGESVSLTVNSDNVYTTFTGLLPRPGGGVWTPADVFDPTLQIVVINPPALAGNTRVTSMWVSVVYEPVPAQLGQAREVGSRRLLAFRRETARVTPAVPAEFLDLELLDDLGLAYFAHPLHAVLGGGFSPWQKIPHRVLRSEFDLGKMRLQLTLKDMRPQLLQFWDVGRSLKTSSPALDGIARLDTGCTRLWDRNSRAWVASPSDGIVHECQDDEEKIDVDGMLFESARTNSLLRSSFISQLTGWTVTTVDGFGTADTAEASLFEPGITGYVAKLVVGAFGGEISLQSTATGSFLANTRISVSVDYRENAASTDLRVRIVRNVDGRYWDGSAWQVAVQDLTVTASTSNARAKWENIDVGGSATTITVTPVLLAGAAGRTAFIKHVQVEAGRWASSRIVTDAAAVTRAIDALRVSNNTAARALNRDRGTVMLRYRPHWTTTAASGTSFYLFDVTYDASNWFRLYYTWNGGGASVLTFEARVAGTTYTASTTVDLAAGTTYRIAARWTSSLGELGVSPFTVSVFLNGTKGTDATATAMPTEAATSDLFLGVNNAITLPAEGNVFDIVHTQQVLTDAEISRGF